MELSIIVLTFNALEYTKKCLKSIQKHTHIDYELIVVDDVSTDDTRKWLHKNPQMYTRLLENEKNSGVAYGRNRGIEVATGDFIVFLDNDTEVSNGWDEQMLEHFKQDKSVMVVGNRGHDVPSFDPLRFNNPFTLGGIAFVDVVPGYCFMFRRELIDLIGNQWQNFPFPRFWHEDLEFCTRVIKAGYKIVADHNISIVHHEHKSMGDNVQGAEESKRATPGFEENAVYVGKRLRDDNIVRIHADYEGKEPWSAYGRIAKHLSHAMRKEGMAVLIDHDIKSQPQSFDLCKGLDFTFNGKRYATMFLENDRPPKDWKIGAVEFDYIMCGSGFAYNHLLGQPYAKKLLDISPVGIDTAVYNRNVQPIENFLGGRFVFMVLGASQPRKNTLNLIQWYAKTFTGQDDVVLLVKDGDYGQVSKTKQLIADIRSTYENAPAIEYVTEYWSNEYQAQVYASVGNKGIYISPHRAEGFGMPHLEALACGCRVATTKFGGPDWNLSMNRENRKPLAGVDLFGHDMVASTFHNWKGEPFYAKDEKPLWAEPREEDVRGFMKNTYNEWRDKSTCCPIETSEYIIREFSYENVARNLISLLKSHAESN